MEIWKQTKWKSYYHNRPHRSGLRIDYEKNVDFEVKRACKEFVLWLRKEYVFPMRVRVYVKETRQIKACDGEMVCGTAFLPYSKDVEPYIRIATGDYLELVEQRGKDNALATILTTLAHELTHYFQWLNDVNLTPIGEERQATRCANLVIERYAQTRDHP